jgi:hypothetical protein
MPKEARMSGDAGHGGACVHQEALFGSIILQIDETAKGVGVPPAAVLFSQPQGASHL